MFFSYIDVSSSMNHADCACLCFCNGWKLYKQAHFAQLYFKTMGLKCHLSLVSSVFTANDTNKLIFKCIQILYFIPKKHSL